MTEEEKKKAQEDSVTMEELMGKMWMWDIVDPEEPEWVKQFKKIAKG